MNDNFIDKKKTISGYSFGTSFLIQYEGSVNNEIIIKNQIDSLFKIINNSLSTYISNSDISKINRGDSLLVFCYLFFKFEYCLFREF